MTDAQMVTIVIAIMASLGALVCNNSRISDLRETMNQRFNDLNQRFAGVNQHVDDKFALLSQQIARFEDNVMRIIGDHEVRLQKLERPTETQ